MWFAVIAGCIGNPGFPDCFVNWFHCGIRCAKADAGYRVTACRGMMACRAAPALDEFSQLRPGLGESRGGGGRCRPLDRDPAQVAGLPAGTDRDRRARRHADGERGVGPAADAPVPVAVRGQDAARSRPAASSLASRTAASQGVSPGSIAPPIVPHVPPWWVPRLRRASSTSTPPLVTVNGSRPASAPDAPVPPVYLTASATRSFLRA